MMMVYVTTYWYYCCCYAYILVQYIDSLIHSVHDAIRRPRRRQHPPEAMAQCGWTGATRLRASSTALWVLARETRSYRRGVVRQFVFLCSAPRGMPCLAWPCLCLGLGPALPSRCLSIALGYLSRKKLPTPPNHSQASPTFRLLRP